MRIIAVSTLRKFWSKHPASREPLQAWYREAEQSNWNNTNELKAKYGNASVITSHDHYPKIDVKKVENVKTN